MRLSVSPCHAVRNSVAARTVPRAVRGGRAGVSRGWCQVVVIHVEKPRAGLISGGSTPIWWVADKLGEAPFKDYWSDDTKNNSREESQGDQARPGTAGG